MTPRPSESGHWYLPDGTPVYEVPNAKGDKLISPDIRHARKLGLYPGSTSIIRAAAAPGLEAWKQQQVLMAALTLPRQDQETDADFVSRVLSDSQDEARKAAEAGTDIHAAIQHFFETGQVREGFETHVGGVCQLLGRNGLLMEDHQWHTERPVAHPLGYGTKVDLACAAWVLDIKTREFRDGEDDRVRCYETHWMQVAAGRAALARYMPECANARGGILWVSRSEPGLVFLAEITAAQLSRGWDMFRALLAFWQHKNNHYPGQERAA